MKPYILVLFDSTHGSTEALAEHIARGIDSVANIESRLRCVPKVSAATEATEPSIPSKGALYCSLDDLEHCSGLAIGSPTRFGNMSANLKCFLDSTASIWMNGQLQGKPATAFTSSSSLHGGQESTLLSMALPLLHHGMLYMGLPYSEPELSSTNTGGTPYGATHWTGPSNDNRLSPEESKLCFAMGKRLASIALRLSEGDA